MTGEQDTGNPAWLPLVERIRRGLLAGEPRLPLSELVELEHPGGEARPSFKSALLAAIAYGDLEAREQERITLQPAIGGRIEEPWTFRPRPVRTVEPFIGRESYRAWRAQCPASLLSPLSQVSKWLGAPTLPQGEPDRPEQGAAAKRQIALVEAEDVALAMLRKRLKREPDFEEFWNHITEQDDTGTIADCGNDRLMWTGKDGRNCETAKSTMRNRLTAAKKRNPFT